MFGENLNVFEVGGCVRDRIMTSGDMVKDVDFAVETVSFSFMVEELENLGFTIWKADSQYITCRAKFPKSMDWYEWMVEQDYSGGLTADFVLCRKDGMYYDGRRPDTVHPGDIFDDLARRDFTVNAMARHPEMGLVDPHNGLADCDERVLRFVGDPWQRVSEDGLRVLRGMRFMVTRDLEPEPVTDQVLQSQEARNMVAMQHDERVYEELAKMFAFNTPRAIEVLNRYHMMPVVFHPDGKMWLTPTMKDR